MRPSHESPVPFDAGARLTCSAPSASMTYSFVRPCAVRTKAISDPSGDQAGDASTGFFANVLFRPSFTALPSETASVPRRMSSTRIDSTSAISRPSGRPLFRGLMTRASAGGA